MHDNTKAAYETSANYSFACSVDFTRDPVDEVKIKDQNYPISDIDLVNKDTENKHRSHLLCQMTLKQQMMQVETTVLPIVWTSREIQ